MKIYVASKFSNWRAVRDLYSSLRADGWEITQDWTLDAERFFVGGLVETDDVLSQAALDDMSGVISADVVVLWLPAARGGHVELGMALALHKPVVIYSSPEALDGDSGYACPFYLAPGVTIVDINEGFDGLRQAVKQTWRTP